MTHVFRWRRTRYGPLNPKLAARFGQRCRILIRAVRPASTVLIEFEDGYRVATMVYAVRKDV